MVNVPPAVTVRLAVQSSSRSHRPDDLLQSVDHQFGVYTRARYKAELSAVPVHRVLLHYYLSITFPASQEKSLGPICYIPSLLQSQHYMLLLPQMSSCCTFCEQQSAIERAIGLHIYTCVPCCSPTRSHLERAQAEKVLYKKCRFWYDLRFCG